MFKFLCFNVLVIFALIAQQILADNSTVYNIKDFRSNPMGIAEREGLFSVKLGVPENARILTYTDFNNDKFVDIILARKHDNGTESLAFYNYNYEHGIFEQNVNIYQKSYPKEYYIQRVIANDLNDDDHMDLVVSLYNTDTKQKSTEVYIFDPSKGSYNLGFSTNSSGVVIADVDGNRLIDLIYYDDVKNERRIVHFLNQTKIEVAFPSIFSSNTEKCDASTEQNKVPIPHDHSSAFVDIDGDCINDIIIASRVTEVDGEGKINITNYMEIWKGTDEMYNGVKKVRYCLLKSYVIPIEEGLGHFTISDINRDGMLDIIFPILNSNNVLIAYNKIKLEYDWSADYCSTHSTSGLNSTPEIFESPQIKANSTNLAVISLSSNPNCTEKFFQDEFVSTIIKVGDINSDSYPDILTIIEDINTQAHISRVYLNIASNPKDDDSKKRTFNISTIYNLPVNDVIYASFFDLDENGQLDLLLVTKQTQNDTNTVTYSIKGLYNNYIYDAFFLKSVTLLNKNVFFSNELGANYRYIATNLDGSRRMDVTFQGIQTGDLFLNLPYAFIGIGRSNNYVENFLIISISFLPLEDNYNVFTPIIPNSQLLISQNVDTSTNPPTTNWELDLIVKPASQLFILIITIVVILVVILAIIIYLHIKEVQEDQETESKNFIAWYS